MSPERKKYKALVITLRVIDIKNDKVEAQFTKTIDGVERRNWISKTVVWATMNKKYVEIINHEDDDE